MKFEVVDGNFIFPASAVRVASSGVSLDYSGRYDVNFSGSIVTIRNWWLPANFEVSFPFVSASSFGGDFPTAYSNLPCLVWRDKIYLMSRVSGIDTIKVHDMNGNFLTDFAMPPLPSGRTSPSQMTFGVYNGRPVIVLTYNWTTFNKTLLMQVWKINKNSLDFYFEEIIFSGDYITINNPYQMLFNYGNGDFACSFYSSASGERQPQAIWCSTNQYFINLDSLSVTRQLLPEKDADLQPLMFMQNTSEPNSSHSFSPPKVSPNVTVIRTLTGYKTNATTRIVETVTAPMPFMGYTRVFPFSLKIPLAIRDNVTGAIVSVPNSISSNSLWTNGDQFGLTFVIGGLYYLFYGSLGNQLTQPLNNYTRLI